MPTHTPRFRGWFVEVQRLRRGAFPSFVTSSRVDVDEVGLPVFTFHTIRPAEFEADLRFLSENGYESVDADSFHAILTGRRRRNGREVLLTIDDGRTSAWVHAYPLLKKYGHRAVVFVIPGCVPERPPLAQMELGGRGATGRAVTHRDPELMSWEEIRIAQRDSVFDIQSHTLFHRQVAVAPDVEDFVTPSTPGPFYSVPLPADREVRSARELNDLAGLPILRSEPLLSAGEIYQEPPEVLYASMDLVGGAGGPSFFERAGWRERLLAEVRRVRGRSAARGRFLEPDEVRDLILHELTASKALLEARLDGKAVNHLCLPFGAGSPRALGLAAEAGYQSVFWTVRPDRRQNAVGDDPFFCVRLKHDYLRRLPGRGRKSLARILAGKVLRRLRGEAVY